LIAGVVRATTFTRKIGTVPLAIGGGPACGVICVGFASCPYAVARTVIRNAVNAMRRILSRFSFVGRSTTCAE